MIGPETATYLWKNCLIGARMKNLHRDAVFFSHFSRAVFTWGTAFDEWQCADLFTENPQMFCMIDVVGKNLHTECKKVLKSQGFFFFHTITTPWVRWAKQNICISNWRNKIMVKYKNILKSKKWDKCPKRVVDVSFSN